MTIIYYICILTSKAQIYFKHSDLPSAVDNSYHPTDSGYGEEHIYNEPTEDDPSFYLEPIKIKMNFDPDFTLANEGRTFSLEEDFSLMEGSVAYTEYLDDNRNQVARRLEGPPKGFKIFLGCCLSNYWEILKHFLTNALMYRRFVYRNLVTHEESIKLIYNSLVA